MSDELLDLLRTKCGGCEGICEDAADEIESLRAQLAEHESNQRAYEEIIGKKTYREVADELERMRKALERVTVFHVEGDDRTHIRICGEETLPANRGTSLQRALLEFDAIQRASLKDLT